MELIRKTKIIITKNGNKIRCGIFKCSFCLQEVERSLSSGYKQKSCGCKSNELKSLANKGENNPMYGKNHTEETRQKQSESKKGKISSFKGKNHTEETRQLMRDNSPHLSGENNPMYGKNHTEETRQKMREAKLGKYDGENNPMYGKKGKNNSNFGSVRSQEQKQRMSEAQTGHLVSEETKQIISELAKERMKDSTKHYNWQGGKSFEIYPQEFKQIKKFILERDNYTCQDSNCDGNHKKLHVHHIDYDKKNNNPENLITLGISCHIKTNFNRPFWMEFYQNIIIDRIVECLL